ESATYRWLSRLVQEFKQLLEAVAAGTAGDLATTEAECAAEQIGLYRQALAELSERLPELRLAVLEACAARHALFDAIQRGDDVAAAGRRLSEALDKFTPHLPALFLEQRQPRSEAEAETGDGLDTTRGGIKYGKTTVDLSGKPLACIRALLDAYDHRLDWQTLRDRVWGQDVYTAQGTIKNAMSDARDALRKLA